MFNQRDPMGGRGGRWADEHGQVAIVVALMLVVLLAFAALVVDVGLNWAARTQAQAAADAAALAGVIALPGDPAAAVEDVRYYLNANVPGLAGTPGWEHNGTDADGDITCWTPPAEVPPPGTHGCQFGDTAIQVITPPLQVDYAFAGVFGANGNQIKALAAAVRGPPVTGPTPCAICLQDRHAPQALSVTANGDVTVANAGVMVNSDHSQAAVLRSSGDLTADWIGVVGGFTTISSGRFTPTPDTGLGPLPDPLADLLTPDQLDSLPNQGSVTVGSANQAIDPGVYDTIAVTGGGDLILDPGTYVVTGGLTLSAGAVVGAGVTIYLACAGYPTPCSGPGAGFSQTGSGQYLAIPPVTGPYQGLALFADRGNTAPLNFTGSGASTFTGTIYARQAAMRLTSGGVLLQLDSLIVVRTLEVSTSAELLLDFVPANNAVTSSWGANLSK
jgi:Putative Flp pilus-assembly TadE/G-like